MSLRDLFLWLEAMPSSTALRESIYGYPILLTAHVVTITLFAGLIIIMDLRLVGLISTRTAFSEVQSRLFPWQMFGFALSAITGLLLFYSQPMRFYGNFYFWLKAVLMALAGLNMMVFHLGTYKSVASWDHKFVTPSGARMAGILSIGLWAAVIAIGRMIAYSGLAPAWWVALNLE